MMIQLPWQFTATYRWLSLLVLLIGGLTGWRWWQRTQPMRALSHVIATSSLDAETKVIMTKLAWTPSAWESGLIRSLSGPLTFKQIVWKDATKPVQTCIYNIVIFDAFIRSAADHPIPPVCVVFDEHKNLVTWAYVAPHSSGFLSATLNEENILTMTTVANWFFGKGIYRYAIEGQSLVPLDDGEFMKFNDQDRVHERPRRLSPAIAL